MEFVRLVDYVKEGELFEKIEGEYEQIVSDYDFGDIDFVKIKKFSDLKKVDLTKKTLFILDKLLLDNIFHVLGKMEKFAVIDMNFGITGYGKKIGHTKLIINELLNLGIEIYEPYDLLSFLIELSGNDGKKYFRITNLDLPENISNGERKSHLSLEGFGFNGGNFSIVTTGSMLAEIVRFGNLLQENGMSTQIFVLNKLDELELSSFGNRKNIIFIFDGNGFGYDEYVKGKLGIENLKFITPKYDSVSTVIDEYILESAEISADDLLRRFENVL